MQNILIIDDHEALCNELAELFRGEGYIVDNSSDSGDGAALIKKNKYDVYIFDYKMKGLDGIDLLVMAKEANPQGAVFIVSGKSSINLLLKKKKIAALAAGVLGKPFDVEEILTKIKAVNK